jgi:hypothetical protein
MDDESNQLLREIRDSLTESSAREAAWIEEMRAIHNAPKNIWQKTSGLAILVLFLLVLLLELVILGKLFGTF